MTKIAFHNDIFPWKLNVISKPSIECQNCSIISIEKKNVFAINKHNRNNIDNVDSDNDNGGEKNLFNICMLIDNITLNLTRRSIGAEFIGTHTHTQQNAPQV